MILIDHTISKRVFEDERELKNQLDFANLVFKAKTRVRIRLGTPVSLALFRSHPGQFREVFRIHGTQRTAAQGQRAGALIRAWYVSFAKTARR
jgi:hypothetical protein